MYLQKLAAGYGTRIGTVARRTAVINPEWLQERVSKQAALAATLKLSQPRISRAMRTGLPEKYRQAVADFLSVAVDTVPLISDATSGAFARRSSGVTGERATSSGMTTPVTPPVQVPGGDQQEGVAVPYRLALRAYGIVLGMDDSLQAEAVEALREWRDAHERRATGGSPPQPAARRSESRRRKRR